MKKSTKRKSKGSKVNSSKPKFTEIVEKRPQFEDLYVFDMFMKLGTGWFDYKRVVISAHTWYDARAYLMTKYGISQENISLTENGMATDPDVVIRWEGNDYGAPNKHKVIWSRI